MLDRMKILCGLFVVILMSSFFLTGCEPQTDAGEKAHVLVSMDSELDSALDTPLKQVILTMGSWRMEDVEQINTILKKFHDKYPHIVIKFDPTIPSYYNDVLETQFESGTAPDLFYLRSFSQSRKLYTKNYLASLNNIPNVRKIFSQQALDGWSSDNGDIYGIPLMSVSHGIYYNKTLFEEIGLHVPRTWAELIALSDTLNNKGITPFANATGDLWTINALILQNLIPNFIGGEKGRLEYYNGTRCFNDDDMIAAFQAVQDLSPYLPESQKLLKYQDSLQLFLQGKAAMLFSGSWDIPFFEEQSPEFEWQIFPIPAPEDKELYVTVHPDAGIGLNSSSPYTKEASLFLEWLTTQEFAQLFAQQLPGFFPMHNEVIHTDNKYANIFLAFNQMYKTDIRIWGKIPKYGEPSAYAITRQASVDVLNNIISPKEAADKLQAGLSAWYIPAQQCPHHD